MSAHGRPEPAAAPPATVLGRSANSIESFIKPAYTWLGYLGAVTLGLLVLAMFYSIVARTLFNAPLAGSTEITQLALVLMVAFVFAIEHMGFEKMTVDILVKRFPAKMRAVIAPAVYLLILVALCVVCWQLIKLGNTYREAGQTLRNVPVPIYPFTYLLVLGFVTLIPIYLVRFLRALDAAVKK